MKDSFNEFISYIREKRNVILLAFLFFVVFSCVWFFYRLPLNAILYPVGICVFLGLIALFTGFFKERQKLETLRRVEKEIGSLELRLPNPDFSSEEIYQSIIETVKREKDREKLLAEERYSGTLDYFTLWVHQIKTPIASMKLMLSQMDGEEAMRLQADLNRIEAYVSMVLTYLRLDFESTDYVLRDHSLDSIIKPVIRKFAPDFIAKRISLNYTGTDEHIITDDKWFSIVLEQIISNAVKYTAKGSVTIECKDGKIMISDTGIGIEPADLPRVFEKGYTGFNGRKDKKASGIGLYLCKRICDDLGTGIVIESEPGAGTRVILDISQHRPDVRD
ncbi:MAG: sensor histidine kinase [Eubacteriales bacterium]|nr:sensor histidine kinase [Eubacteriales bacterium]